MTKCNDDLDWGEIGFWCQLPDGHEMPHEERRDDPSQRAVVIQWADDPWWERDR